MFRSLKKRVKNLSGSIHGSRNGGTDDGSEKLNTPARQYTAPPPIPQSASPNTVSSIGSDSASNAGHSKPNPGRPQRVSSKSKKRNVLDIPLEELDVVSKIEHLAPFDICIQVSDALAAASGLSDHRHVKQSDSVMSEARIDEATGLPCTSILVSPDGYMLLIPPGKEKGGVSSGCTHDTANDSEPDSAEPVGQNDTTETETTMTTTRDGMTFKNSSLEGESERSEANNATIGDDNHDADGAPFSNLRLNGKDDYESSIYVGHDLHPSGDKALNGFSAKGWSIPATSLALEQTEQSLNALAHFCEQMILSRKESAARTAFACDNLRRAATTIQHGKSTAQELSGSWVMIDPRAGDFEMSPSRTGPLLAERSTLASALSSFEEFYVKESEKEASRWRMASLQRGEILPKVHDAVDQLHERSLKRQQALQESSRRVQVLEERVRALQEIAESKWQAVYEAEERVTIRQQKLMEERRQQREKARLEKLQLDEVSRTRETTAVNKGDAALGATSKEIWDMVSSVVDPSADPGSFEPMDLPTAPLAAPRDRSAGGSSFDDASVISTNTASSDTNNGSNLNLTEPSLPFLSRDEIAVELGLPQLRAAALQADDSVRDTSDCLLNILSTLDTTRRSARVAAETCLLSAANAQSECLQNWIQLEKESLIERLAGLNALEANVKASFNIRADLDAYITIDKKERGGSSHLGDDDDGGVASALAVLSSHVDGMDRDPIEGNVPQKDNVNDDESDVTSQSQIDEAIDRLFEETHGASDTTANTNLETSVQLLCKIATEQSRAKRSAICYSLNSKRSNNAKMQSSKQFDALSQVFNSLLTGCNAEVEVGGVAVAKMCMMLSQTFYIDNPESIEDTATASNNRNRRIYVKSRLVDHPIWSKDDYWYV